MQSVRPPTVSNLAPSQQYEETPTPTMSNRASPKQLPPALNLENTKETTAKLSLPSQPATQYCSLLQHNGEHSSSSNSLSSQGARFSSLTAEPIEMKRPFSDKGPVSFSPPLAAAKSSKNYPARLSSHARAVPSNGQRSKQPTQSKSPDFSLALRIPDATVMSDGDGAFWLTLFLEVMPYSLACDIIKTGAPWTLFRNFILSLWYRCSAKSSKQFKIQAPTTRQIPVRAATTTTTTSRSSVGSPFSNTPSLRQGVIQGISNFGQTCYMNSVIQSLASLEPFLAYLERLHRVQQDTQTLGLDLMDPSTDFHFAQQVLELIMAANGFEAEGPAKECFVTHTQRGNHNRLRIDPRPLLGRIGESHAQFHRKHIGEQQDAQEWLQALMGVVISEAQLDSITAASDHMRFGDGDYSEGTAAKEAPLTAVVAGAEKFGMGGSIYSSGSSKNSNTTSDDEQDIALSLSTLLERIDEGQRLMQQVSSEESSGEIGVASGTSSTTLDSLSSPKDGRQPFPEEKKQEDFEVTVPAVASEQDLESIPKKHVPPQPPPSRVVKVPKDQQLSTSALSDTTLGEGSRASSLRSQSTAMKIVKSTISSITPSPLSGWLGSTIQCCNCQHVRPIRNSPFLDIPLVPTSVPSFLGGVNKQGPNASSLPACTIEQCFADFTSVERVQDVECRNCTIQAQICELQEEEMFLSGAIESTERRVKTKGGDPVKETKSLRHELDQLQLRLLRLRTMDPDEEDLDLICPSSHGGDSLFLDESRVGSSSRIARCDARKCLFLTRCPSVLCCHVQRRYYDPYLDRMEKCVQHIVFDEVLNLAPYCAYSQEASASWVAGSSRSDQQHGKDRHSMLYRLQSIVEHRGNANGGHYVCYRRFGSSWYRISDNSVTSISWKQVRSCQAYMLFYEAM